MKKEGAALPPVPLTREVSGETMSGGARTLRESAEARCEICGARIIIVQCKRICLRCGFMTGCSEGI